MVCPKLGGHKPTVLLLGCLGVQWGIYPLKRWLRHGSSSRAAVEPRSVLTISNGMYQHFLVTRRPLLPSITAKFLPPVQSLVPILTGALSRLGSTCRNKSPQHHMRSTQAAELNMHCPHGVAARCQTFWTPEIPTARGTYTHTYAYTCVHTHTHACTGQCSAVAHVRPTKVLGE